MILYGQYDSPFVRRVAVTLNHYGIGFAREILSVFGDFDQMLTINPLGKVPALELEDGELLFDSRAILDYLDGLAGEERCLVPRSEPQHRAVLRADAVATGLAEKLYERGFEFARRSPEKRDLSLVERVERQIRSALGWLEAKAPSPWFFGERFTRADVTLAVALTYLKEKQPALLRAGEFPALDAHWARCEAMSIFRSSPYSATEASRSGWRPEPDQQPRSAPAAQGAHP
jgi:glutathione S-transferase